MQAVLTKHGRTALFWSYALFAFSSTFSIALAQISLGLSLILFLGVIWATKYNPFVRRLRWFYRMVGLYVLWLAASAVAGLTPGDSLLVIKEEWLFCAVPIGLYLLDHEDHRRRLVLIFALGVFLVSVYGIAQHYLGLHWFKPEPPPPALQGGYFAEGNFPHHLTFGNYFFAAATFLLAYALLNPEPDRFFSRVTISVAAVLAYVATVFSFARTAVAAIPLILLLLAAMKGRRWLVPLLGLVPVAAIAAYLYVPGIAGSFRAAVTRDLAGSNQAARVYIWKKSAAIAFDHPVFGCGPGNFRDAFANQRDQTRGETRVHVHAHNDILNVAAVAGIPGAVFFLGMWMVVFGYSFTGWRRLRGQGSAQAWAAAGLAASVAFFLSSATEAAFADEEMRQILMFFWAAGLWPWYARLDAKNRLAERNVRLTP